MPANCPESVLSFTAAIPFTISSLPATKAIRQPVILYDFEREWNSTPTSIAPGIERKLSDFPS